MGQPHYLGFFWKAQALALSIRESKECYSLPFISVNSQVMVSMGVTPSQPPFKNKG